MSLPSSATSIHALSCVFRWFSLAVALPAAFSGCRLSDRLSMEEALDEAPYAIVSVPSTVSSGTDDDSALLTQQYVADRLLPVSSVDDRGANTASFTDAPVLLASRAVQICGEVTIVPGTSRRIPYVIPSGWRCVYSQVHVVREIPEPPALDYHVEPLPEDFSFRGSLSRGLLLCVHVPLTYQHGVWNGYRFESVGTPLRLQLEIHLDELPVLGEIGHRSDYVTTMNPSTNSPGNNHLTSPASTTPSDRLSSIAFGTSAWRKYFGVDVGEEPDLPLDIETILNSKALFLLEGELVRRRVSDNHLLTLIPSTVNGEAFTLDKLGALVLQNYNGHFTAFQDNKKKARGLNSHGYGYYSHYLTDVTRQTPLSDASYWVLLPKTVLRDSRDKSFSDHGEMVAKYSDNGYRLPRALEVAASLLAHYARSGGERLYASECNSKRWRTFTRCSDKDKYGYPLVVGGFESSGLSVCINHGSMIDTSGLLTSGSFKPLGFGLLVRLGSRR